MNIRETWQAGVQSEVDFWRAVFVGEQYPDYRREMLQRIDPAAPVVPYIAHSLPRDVPVPQLRILDVAAGPVSCVGWQIGGERPQLTPIDALATHYRTILDEFGLTPPVYTQECDGENIRPRFAPDSFDLVHIRNALDHCYDALAVMRNMLEVLKPGGALIVCGYSDEAEFGHYDGLHQWNIRGEGKQMVIWRPDQRHIVNDLFAAQLASVFVEQDDAARWTSVKLIKR